MIRFLVNAVASLLLALALVFAVGDIARSLAQDGLRLTPLGQALGSLGLALDAGPHASAVTADFVGLVSTVPAALALSAASFLLLLVGRPRRAGRGRAVR